MINFQEKIAEDIYGLGSILITGLCPSNRHYNPLGKIWASVRKRIWEQYGVDVVGLFIYDNDNQLVTGSFCLNYSAIENTGIDKRIYISRFSDTFQLQMQMFEDTLIAFADSPNGLESYEAALARGESVKQLNEILNSFLCSINMRTKEKQRRSKKSKK